MTAFHQLGHQCENLISEVSGFEGAILSPLNQDPATTKTCIEKRGGEKFLFLFDPQLYFPRTERQGLREWHYFPDEYDTADHDSDTWWEGLHERLIHAVDGLGVDIVCSPAIVPQQFSDGYYAANAIRSSQLATNGLYEVFQTLLVRLSDLADTRPEEIASIVSTSDAIGVYLVLLTDVDPRREITDANGLFGAMRLIALLERASVPVLVGFSSTDMVLWKAAGATSCATGKFWNLRRFTPKRFDERTGGGGQIEYWLEHPLLGSIREPDIRRLQKAKLLGDVDDDFAKKVLAQLDETARKKEQKPWLSLSWRQYMSWFRETERRVGAGELDVSEWLKQAEERWERLNSENIILDEPPNDGRWIRPWRQALGDFQRWDRTSR